jgi:ribosomal protein S18 acetylase RimI-like enzyme
VEKRPVRETNWTITRSTGLPAPALAAARDLVARCNAHDSTALLLALKPEQPGDDTTPRYALAYVAGRLVGLAELVGYREIEGTILVAPDHRRVGLGRALATTAANDLAARGITSWLLVCDEAFPGGIAFAQILGGVRAYFEHRLTLDPALVPAVWRGTTLTLRQAGAADAATIARITAAAFGDPPEDVDSWIAADLARPDRRWFLGMVAGEPIGNLRVIAVDGGRDITAFGVLPAQQGRGYGRALLSQTIALLRDESASPINIEVETDNAAALGLYQSCGFAPQHTYGYYRVGTDLARHP